MINDFLAADCVRVTMPAIAADQNDVRPPKLSEICGLLILPMGAAPPDNWVLQSNIEDTADNNVTDNSKAKWLVGRGEMPQPENVIVGLGRDERRIARRLFALEFEVNIRCIPELNFIKVFERQYRSFRFWFATRGGRFLGGNTGIHPKFVDSWTPYERDGLERAFIRIEWYADGSPMRTSVSNLFQNGAGDLPVQIDNIMYYADSYPSQVSSTLTWIKNSGVLPTTNTQAQIMVFQNGQKLEELVQYTINHLTAPGESEIKINAHTHFSGANYEVISIITS